MATQDSSLYIRSMSDDTWKVCSICKKGLPFEGAYYVCSVSTCQRKRTGLVFCSPQCFDAHLPMMRHRDAWAEQATAPSRAAAQAEADVEAKEQRSSSAPVRRSDAASPPPAAASAPPAAPSASTQRVGDGEVLVVVSKLKKFIREQSGMNTSDNIVNVLSRHLRELSIQALRAAAADGRKTVFDRDFEAALKRWRGSG